MILLLFFADAACFFAAITTFFADCLFRHIIDGAAIFFAIIDFTLFFFFLISSSFSFRFLFLFFFR